MPYLKLADIWSVCIQYRHDLRHCRVVCGPAYRCCKPIFLSAGDSVLVTLSCVMMLLVEDATGAVQSTRPYVGHIHSLERECEEI